MNIAGCQMEDMTITEAIVVLKNTIDVMLREGAIE